MSREEALTAVLNAARALQTRNVVHADTRPATVTVRGADLLQLYAAVDAIDAVDGQATVRSGLCQGDPECWRYADLPTGTCHHHSPQAQKPHPWQEAHLRAGVFAVGEVEDD